MAGPLIPIGLMIAAMGANKLADNQVQKERQRRIQAENMRQRQLGAEADATLREELEQQSRPAIEAEKNQQAATREAKYEQAMPTQDQQAAAYQTTPSAPKEVKSEIARQVVASLKRGRQQAKALSRLGGQADANMESGVDLMRGAQSLNRIGNQSRASSQILPYELQDANQKGEGWRTVGDVANLAGMAYGLYGMTTPPAATGAYGSTGGARNLFAP